MAQNTGFIYKNKPLVRSGDKIFYGDPADKYIICMTVETDKNVNGLNIPEKLQIQLISTDPSMSKRKRIVRTTSKEGFYRSLDIAEAWLKRYLRGNEG